MRLASTATSRADGRRSEEHTSELQSRFGISYAVFFLKKKTLDRAATILRLSRILIALLHGVTSSICAVGQWPGSVQHPYIFFFLKEKAPLENSFFPLPAIIAL